MTKQRSWAGLLGLGVFLFLPVFCVQTLLPPYVHFWYACFDWRQVHSIYIKVNGTVCECNIYFSRWADTSEAILATSVWGTSAQHRASWQSVSQALKAKGQRYQSEIGKRDVMEHQPGPTGNMGSWAGVVFHSWWPLWTAVCRVFDINLFTLLTCDPLWTLDNCQQRSTAKTAHSFNGGSFKQMDYLHKTVKRMLFFLRPFKHSQVECFTRWLRHSLCHFF